VDADAYEAASATVMSALRETHAVVEVLGWDEAFLGVETDDPEGFACHVQRRVREASDLDCSVGIGQNKLQAKLATEFGKPAGVYRLTSENWFEVLGDRTTDALWGIGSKTAKRLAGLGITTVSELAGTDPHALAAELGPTTGPWLVGIARGRASAVVDGTPHVARSRSRETTFQENLEDWARVRTEVSKLANRVARDVLAEGRPTARVVVKVRYAPFFTRTHGCALPTPTTDAHEIERGALAALELFTPGRPVRLLGVRAEFSR
jgi:DNA polymerase-4